jgi:transposase
MKGADPATLDPGADDALRSEIICVRRFACELREDAAAVRNATTEIWTNRLKAPKRAMYGRAGVSLPGARMSPHTRVRDHTD